MSHLSASLKNLCLDYKLPKEYSKSEFDHEKINKNNYM